MSPLPVRVLKFGGSLFDDCQFPARLHAWMERQSPAHQVIVVGGGPLADAIRAADQVFHLNEVAAHTLCLETMRMSVRLFAEILAAAEFTPLPIACELDALASRFRAAENLPQLTPQIILFDAGAWLLAEEARADVTPQQPSPLAPLPRNWSVTSDSIAAHVAVRLGAEELVLLKSVAPIAASRNAAAAEGVVDSFFPTASSKIPHVRLVNLRSPTCAERVLF